jgi:glycosyltransferase involved in cell wall biosynthesis
VRIAIDASPFVVEPRRGVARALENLLRGFAEIGGREGVAVATFAPRAGESLAAFRRRLRHEVRPVGFDAFLSPWSAFPDVAVPVVVTVHELPFVRCGPVEGRWREWRHRRWLARDVRRANRIVVPSRATRDDVLAVHPEARERVRVVAHGFAPPTRPTWAALESSTILTVQDKFLATAEFDDPLAKHTQFPRGIVVGGRSARKGLDVWLPARHLVGDLCDWILVGEPPRAVRRAVRDDPRVRVVSNPSDVELAALIAGSSVVVYPSRSEGFGFPPLEAMALDVPVVASAAGAIPAVCGDAALLVPPGDPHALAAGIRRVFDDYELRVQLELAGRERATAFPPEAAARGVLEALREAAAEGPR